MYYRFIEDLIYREKRRLVNDLITCMCYRFIEDLIYREKRRLVNDLICTGIL